MLEINTVSKDDLLIVELEGALDSKTSSDFKAWVEEKIIEGYRAVAFDCEQLDYISSKGIGSLLELRHILKVNEGAIALFNVSQEIKNLLAFLRILNEIPAFDDLSAASAHLINFHRQPATKRVNDHEPILLPDDNAESSKQVDPTGAIDGGTNSTQEPTPPANAGQSPLEQKTEVSEDFVNSTMPIDLEPVMDELGPISSQGPVAKVDEQQYGDGIAVDGEELSSTPPPPASNEYQADEEEILLYEGELKPQPQESSASNTPDVLKEAATEVEATEKGIDVPSVPPVKEAAHPSLDKEENLKVSITVIHCPNCYSQLKVSKPAYYLCPACRSKFEYKG